MSSPVGPENPLPRSRRFWFSILTLASSTLTYAVLRYAVFSDVSLDHLPVFLINKSVSMVAAFALCLASLAHAHHDEARAQRWGRTTWHCVFIHILLSLAILSRGYYAKFFDQERMTLGGELTVLFGVLGAYLIWVVGARGVDLVQRRGLALLASLMVGGHLVAMGYSGWIEPATWPGGLPPISLISFVAVLASLVLLLRTRSTEKVNKG